MDCSDVQKHCQTYLDGELDPEQSEFVQSHLQACRCCADHYQSQEQFHLLLRKSLTHRCSASVALRDRIAATLADSPQKAAAVQSFHVVSETTSLALSGLQPRQNSFSPEHIARNNAPSHAGFSAAHFFGVAAMLMLLLGGYLVYNTPDGKAGIQGRPPVVLAAEKAHDRIAASAPSAPEPDGNPSALTAQINSALKVLPRFAGIPNLSNCRLQAVNCGPLDCKDLPKGVFVKFVECGCEGTPVTLLALECDKLPAGDEVRGFVTDSSPGHSVVSWRSCKDGLLYMLVTKMPMEGALAVAEAARQ